MKQKIVLLCVAVILVLSLASCAGNNTTTPENPSQASESVTKAQTVEATKAEGFTEECKQAYLSIIDYYERTRGKYESETYINDFDMEEVYSDGVMFCDLFDWDLNGTPELIIGYASRESCIFRVSAIEIYTYDQGGARLVLKEAPRHSFSVRDASERIYFSRSNNGKLMLRVDDVDSECDTSDSNYYQYDGTSVSVKKLGFYYTTNDEGNVIARDYYINGIPCTEDEYKKCEADFCGIDLATIDIKAYDYSDLVSLLSGKSDSCNHLLFKPDNEIPQWFLKYLAF